MGRVKNCTTIEQARVLMGFLPLDSADYCYKTIGEDPYDLVCRPYSDWKEEYRGLLISNDANVVPCWSLASLFGMLPVYVYNNEDCLKLRMDKSNVDFNIWYVNTNTGTVEDGFNVTALNELDACYEMLKVLNEKELL